MADGKMLVGERIVLREIFPEMDSYQWFTIMCDPEMHVWTGNTVPERIEETVAMLKLYKQHHDLIAWSIICKEKEEMIGTYWIVKPNDQEGKRIIADEAQRIARKYWRSGFTKEARKLVYSYAFEELLADEIHAHAWSDNVRSCRSMESTGFRLIERYERFNPKYNRDLEECHYVLLRDEWMNRKGDKENGCT